MKHPFNRIVASTLVAPSPTFAMTQTWSPSKVIFFVGLLAPGSSNYLMARVLSAKLPVKLGQLVIVDNRPGTSGLVGAASVARSAPDGHAIVIMPSDVYMAPILTPKAGYARHRQVVKDLNFTVECGTS